MHLQEGIRANQDKSSMIEKNLRRALYSFRGVACL